MALPGDVTSFTMTFGSYLNVLGSTALEGLTGKITPVNSQGKPVALTHVGTGRRIIPETISFSIASDGTGSVGPLPHSDNAVLSPDEFLYKVEWDLPGNRPSPGNAMVYVPAASGTTVDYDLLVPVASSAPVSVSLPAVTAVAGHSGAVTAADLVDALDDALADDVAAGVSSFALAQRAAFVARQTATQIPLSVPPVQARVRFPLGTSGRMVLGTERGRVGALLINTSATQVLKVGIGTIDTSSAPGAYTDVPVGQELPVSVAAPVWAYYPTTADTVLVVTEVAA